MNNIIITFISMLWYVLLGCNAGRIDACVMYNYDVTLNSNHRLAPYVIGGWFGYGTHSFLFFFFFQGIKFVVTFVLHSSSLYDSSMHVCPLLQKSNSNSKIISINNLLNICYYYDYLYTYIEFFCYFLFLLVS